MLVVAAFIVDIDVPPTSFVGATCRLDRTCASIFVLTWGFLEGLETEKGKKIGLLMIHMEYIEGKNMQQLFARTGKGLTPGEFKEFYTQLSDVIEYLHEKGVTHGDIKPENIMWPEVKDEVTGLAIRDEVTGLVKHQIKLIDFGFSADENRSINEKIFGVLHGTPSYIPVDCITGTSKKEAKNVDIFAVYATCLWVITGGKSGASYLQETFNIKLSRWGWVFSADFHVTAAKEYIKDPIIQKLIISGLENKKLINYEAGTAATTRPATPEKFTADLEQQFDTLLNKFIDTKRRNENGSLIRRGFEIRS